MPPLIGITCAHDILADRYFVALSYVNAVSAAGGAPVLLPSIGTDTLRAYDFVDGLVLTGGNDVDPVHFGEEPLPGNGEVTPDRDVFELELTRWCLDTGKPILAICRGAQVLNIAAGGDIYQDIYTQVPGVLKHVQQAPRWYPSHGVHLEPGSRLDGIYQGGLSRVNSFHHQAVRRLGAGFKVCATSADGVIEGIESTSHPFAVGVQWHPEAMWQRIPLHLNLFSAFIASIGKCKAAGAVDA
ncbi:peptidase C26 [Clostridiales bacterium PH28_bin88]|nr:peptidase C26 [Clostridiales bacterium PH28_bin88]